MKKNNIQDIYQLSPVQQGMLFHTLYAPSSGVYCQQFSCTFTGSLDVEAFSAAWQQVVARHVVLRTAFIWERQDVPLQVVYRQVKLPLEIHSWIGLSPQEQQQQLVTFLEKDQQRGFQLTKAPLMRLNLIQMSDDVYQFVWSYHHILLDGWSLPLVFKEVLFLYEAKSLGQELQLPPSRSYREYIAWLQKQNLADAEQFWRQTLQGVTAPTPLVIDKAHHSNQVQQSYSEEILLLSSEATTALVSFARKYQLTLNTLVQAAWALLLLRYSGETDVIFGVTVSGRTAAISGVESIVGLFINTLPMRVGLSGEDTVLPWLKQIHKLQVEISSYEYTPLVQIQRHITVTQGLPLFESIVVFENYPVDETLQQNSQKLHISDVRAFERNNYPLTLIAQPGVQLSLRFIYDSQRFDSASVTRMVGHFQALLEGLVANPDQKLSHIPLLSATEQHQILIEWNNTQAPYPQEKCLHSLFEEQVQKTPNAIALSARSANAVVFEEQRLTYSELNTRANQLAHYLQALGVGPEVLVGVCLERCVEMVVALLGILKAGGAYVPMDPEYPQERLAYMLEDSRVKVLLTQEKLVARLAQQQAHLVCLDTNWQAISESSAENPRSVVLPHHLAYVIYTSGSTGAPKGAMNTHQAICNRLVWMQQAYQITPDDRILQKTPFSFDVSVWEFFWPLITGARLVVAQPGGHRDSANLVKLIAKEQITTLHFVPSMLQVFLSEQSLESCISLRQVFCSGEALPKELQERFFERLGCSLHNLYGPTEAAIDVTYWQCQPDSELLTVPIGRAIANTQIYILDRDNQPVPVGVAGELHIGGVGLARGYLNRPELTAEKFIPNPFASAKLSDRLYKTGDLVRYCADGNIEYLGRIDHQVKVRGFRIELGEIEAALSQHPNVRQTVVIATQEMVGPTRLVAYLVANQQPAPTIGELRAFLKQKLPEYMVPSAFVVLETLPLTPNGKLDRRALPKPSSQPELSGRFVAPRTPTEKILANIWASVLGIESVGIHDNFFELGGDSILSIQIIAKANSAGVQLSAKQIFEHQTIAELATVAVTAANKAQQGVVSGALPLTPIQQWFFCENFASPAHWNQAVFLEMPPGIQPNRLQQVVHSVLVHHDALRLRFEKTDSGWQQINAVVDDTVPFTVVDLSALPQAQQPAAIEAKAKELQASLNLSTGPVVQVAWFNLGSELNSRLLIVIHHLAVDGVSWRILLEDLQVAYSQLSAGAAIQLPPKTTSFKDWAQLQFSYVQSQDLQHHRDFWLLQSKQQVANIPVDYPGGANTEASARTVSCQLSVEETRALLQEVPKAYNTQINDALLTALVQVLADWTQSNHVLFNLEGHGREDFLDSVNVSRTVGWFTTIFPVVVHKATDHPAEALKSIKEQLRAIPQQGISYGWLRYLLDDADTVAQLQAQPKAQVVFNHLGQFDGVVQTSEIFKLASESSGPSRSPRNYRSHLLEVNSIIIGAQLRVDWTYSQNLHNESTIERLAHEFLQALRALITHCLAPEAFGYTPTDFPLAQLNNVVLEQLLSNIVPPQGIGKTNWKNIADIYPLSSMQQGMLFHTLYAPSSGVYCQQLSCTFAGALDVEAFAAAWQQVVARHVVLRTAFTWEHSEVPLQVVYRQVKLPLEIHSWLGLSADEQQQQLATFIEQEQHRGFQLDKAPLMRLNLIQMSDDVYQFVWSYHHILLDGWSLPLVFKEVLGYYEALSLGQELQLLPTRSYREYIAWLQKQKLEAAEQFWRQTLQGVTAPTPLVVDKAHHSNQVQQSSSSYSEEILTLSSKATTALVKRARKYQLTLNTLVQAAWAILLWRYSGETDVVFGVTVSGRSGAILGVESIVGLFINTLPMRVGLKGSDTVLPKLKQIHKQQVEISTYEYTPLVQIQGWTDVPRGQELFESIVVFENYPVDGALQQNSQNLHISDVRAFQKTNYPLTIEGQPGVQLSLRFNYDTQRFESGSVTRMMGHFQTLLEGIVTNPKQRLADLPLLKVSERQQLLFEWNDTQTEYPQDKCIHQLFEEQVELTPNAVALVYHNEQLTYRELNTRANQLAHYLQGLGVGPEVLVGICVERSLEMVVGLLGILKAGGAYVPLDPTYPQERLTYMLSDSLLSVLLTQGKLVADLPEQTAHIVCLDSQWGVISCESQQNPLSGVQPSHLAYVIYTSGSTGKPKGVLVAHQGLCNLAQAQTRLFDVNSDSRILQFVSFSFDASIGEVIMALCSGASLYLGTKDSLLPGQNLMKFLRTYNITHVMLTPSALAVLPYEELPALRTIVVGGEAFSSNLVTQWSKDRCFFNAYGPTESTVCATVAECTDSSNQLSIGRPIANTQIYILDRHLQPVPTGVPGELHIGGVGLARGYLNRPETTAEKFIPNPFSSEPGSRLYKTGDLARYLSDGNIEYIGRIDEQVKIRGFRIELGEIEAVLTQHPDVNCCLTIVREDAPGEKRLVAYVVADIRTAVTISELRSFLKQKLPHYMVPSAFVMLDALPLTPSGKIDRRALPKPSTTRHKLETALVAPCTESEEILAKIWREVLHLEQVGIHDNFFELGGDSILSIQIIFKAKQAGLQLTAKQIFEHLTIAELAAVANVTQTPRAEQGHLSGLLPLTPIQHWFFEQNLPEPHHFNQSFLLEVPQTFDPALLSQVVQQLLVHHDALRLRFVQSGSDWEQVNTTPDDTIPFSHVDLSAIPDVEQKAAIEAAATSLQASLNLSSEPLMRVAFFALGSEKPSRLLIVIHHLAVDGVSWRILLDDLQTAYQQLSRGEKIQLSPKTTSFKHWAVQLASYARSDTAKKELTYWQGISRTQISRLPVDNVFGTNTVASARTVSVSLSPGETRALLQEVPKAYQTQINDILLTALVQVFGKWTGNNSVLLDLEGHGREDIFEHVDLSRTVGWFTTIFPLLLELKPTDNLGDAIKSIKEQLCAVPNGGIGYGLLRYLSGDADIISTLQALPQAEVSFNYLGQLDSGMQENSFFKLAPESVGSQQSKLGSRSHLLDINGLVVESQLQLDWTYSENFHKRATIESLAQDFAASLRSLIAHCLSADAGGDTPNVSEQTVHSFTQQINNDQRQENNASVPLHLLELPEGISELLPSDIESAYPLAKMQEFMLHHYANDHQKMGVYHCQQSYDIYDDNLSLNAFKKALEISVQKHPALRTVFLTSNGKPAVQVVKKNLTFSINEHDISNMEAEEQESYVDEVGKQDRHNLFNVENSNEPLFRFWIFQKAKNKFEFFMSIHHAIIDGWSNIEFMNQLYEFYSALKKGEEITVAKSGNVYKEFVALEKEILGSLDASDFWKLHLKNYTYKPLKPLITSVVQVEAVVEEYNLNSEIIADLREFSQKLKVSPKALFLSTYVDLIGTVMKESTVSVGVISNGRTERLSDPFRALGLFWNIVPFCQQVIEDKEVQIKNVQQSLIDIEPYVRYPLLEILSYQQKPELFFATFNFMSFHNAKNLFEQTDLKVNARRSHDKFNFPLNFAVSMKPSSEDVSIRVEYDQMYFSCLEIRSMLHNYVEILYAVHRL